jgi:hypothetical protein
MVYPSDRLQQLHIIVFLTLQSKKTCGGLKTIQGSVKFSDPYFRVFLILQKVH